MKGRPILLNEIINPQNVQIGQFYDKETTKTTGQLQFLNIVKRKRDVNDNVHLGLDLQTPFYVNGYRSE